MVDCMKSPISFAGRDNPEAQKYADGNYSYRFYKIYISPVRGSTCPMDPSCSTYARETFARYGFLKGFAMMSDRIIRCGNDLSNYASIERNNLRYAYDPVPDRIQKSARLPNDNEHRCHPRNAAGNRCAK